MLPQWSDEAMSTHGTLSRCSAFRRARRRRKAVRREMVQYIRGCGL